MRNLECAYVKLFNDANITNGFQSQGKLVTFSKLSHLVAMQGTHYESCPVRFMLVGRATNGWKSLDCTSADCFSNAAKYQFKTSHFNWVKWDSDKKALRNIDEDGGNYWLNRSSFWRTAMKIWRELPGTPDIEDNENQNWTDYIAWSNLYKVAPSAEGNPTEKMCKAQLSACKDILSAEIEILNPTHILFFTGYEGWFRDFSDMEIFKSTHFSKAQQNICRGEKKNNVYVETSATMPNGTKIVVCCRPEGRDEKAYINDVLNHL